MILAALAGLAIAAVVVLVGYGIIYMIAKGMSDRV